MDFDLNADEKALADLCRDFAEGEIAPVAAGFSEEERCPTEILRHMGKLGLMGLLVPEEYGGTDVSTIGFVAAMEQIGRADQSIAAAWQAHMTIGSLPLATFGTPEQRERWLVPLAQGEALGSFGLTEPDAGSDAAAIRTKAERVGDHWEVTGNKMFISNAGTEMSWGTVVLARVGKGADGRERYGNFIIERDSPGFTIGKKLRGIGWRALDTRPLAFDGVEVPDDRVLGDPGRGLGQFLKTLEVGRISIAALSVSLGQAVLEMALDYAKKRVQFGTPISKHQAIQFKLADIAAEVEAARLLTYKAASLRDAGKPFGQAAAIAKMKASRVAVAAASEAVQIHGGYGYMMEQPVARFYCDAKILEIGEGSNEIQHLVIARSLGC